MTLDSKLDLKCRTRTMLIKMMCLKHILMEFFFSINCYTWHVYLNAMLQNVDLGSCEEGSGFLTTHRLFSITSIAVQENSVSKFSCFYLDSYLLVVYFGF